MHRILEQIVESAKFYQHTYPEDACVVVTDTEKIVLYLPGKTIDLKLQVGAGMSNYVGSVTEKALRLGQAFKEERGPEQFGVAYVSTAYPIIVDGELIGVISSMVSNERFDVLRSGATDLVSMIEELSATTEELARGSQQIAEQVQDASETSMKMTEEVHNTESISMAVTELANQSNLLGLNAAIEAARAGESGRGFSVVADEIRKMATQSKNSSVDIKSKLGQLLSDIEHLSDGFSTIASASEEHAAGVQEMKAVFEQITHIAENLLQTAQID